MVNPHKGEVEIKIDPERKILRTIDKQRPIILKYDVNSLAEVEEEIRPRTIFDVLDDAFRRNVPIALNEARVLLAHGLGIPKVAAGMIMSQKTSDYTGEILPKIGEALMYATEGNILKFERREEEESELLVEVEEEDAATGEKKRKK